MDDEAMLGSALRTAYGPLADLSKKLATSKDNGEWHRALKRFLRKDENPWETDSNAAKNDALLTDAGGDTITVDDPFVAGRCFRKDTSNGAQVKIDGFGTNFKAQFLPLVEEGGSAVLDVVSHDIQNAWEVSPVRVLRETRGVILKLSHLWALLRKQRTGHEDGLLSIRGINVFYLYGADNHLWVVHAHSAGPDRGWSLKANPMHSAFDTPGASYRVISAATPFLQAAQ